MRHAISGNSSGTIANGVIIELSASPWRLDMDWRHWRKAAERGLLALLLLSPGLAAFLYGVSSIPEAGTVWDTQVLVPAADAERLLGAYRSRRSAG